MCSQLREILVCVAGATPQIITETIYALSNKNPPVYIDELFIITTKKGREIIKESLTEKGYLNSLLLEYELPHIKFDENSFVLIKNNGTEIDDIRNTSESEAAANTIINFIREITKRDNIRLHCSIAGGRKTMSFYLGSALQLFGRPWDKLYHVLVSPEFESNPEFFYPPRQPCKIKCRLPDGSVTQLDSSEAKIDLAEIPFIRLREKIELKSKTFIELIRESQQEIDLSTPQPKIYINLKNRNFELSNNSLRLPPVMLTVYTFFLMKKTDCSLDRNCASCNDCFISLLKLTEEPYISELTDLYFLIYDKDPIRKMEFKEKYTSRYAIDIFRSYISKINSIISSMIKDKTTVVLSSIKSIRKYGSTVYGIPVDKRRIKIEML